MKTQSSSMQNGAKKNQLHWTQTRIGRARMKAIMAKRHASKKAFKVSSGSESKLMPVSESITELSTPNKREMLVMLMHDPTSFIVELDRMVAEYNTTISNLSAEIELTRREISRLLVLRDNFGHSFKDSGSIAHGREVINAV